MLLPWGPNCGVLCCESVCVAWKKLGSAKLFCWGNGWAWVVARKWVLFNPALVTAYEDGSWIGSKPKPMLCWCWKGACGLGEGECAL